MAPDTVHEFLLVSTNLKQVVLAELVEDTGGAVPEILLFLAQGRVLNLVSLEDLLGLATGRNLASPVGDLLRINMLEETLHALVDEIDERFLDRLIEFVLGDEGGDDEFESRHLFEGLNA